MPHFSCIASTFVDPPLSDIQGQIIFQLGFSFHNFAFGCLDSVSIFLPRCLPLFSHSVCSLFISKFCQVVFVHPPGIFIWLVINFWWKSAGLVWRDIWILTSFLGPHPCRNLPSVSLLNTSLKMQNSALPLSSFVGLDFHSPPWPQDPSHLHPMTHSQGCL